MIELADIIAPITPPPAPPPYEWIALGAVLCVLILFFGLWFWLKRTRKRHLACAALKRTERALNMGKIDARAAVFDIAHAVSHVRPPSLPFKGEEEIAWGDPEWADFTQALTHARFSPHPIDAQHAVQLLAQARLWIGRTPC